MSGPHDEAPDSVRLDKWLVAVRVFKSRSLAAQAIKGGKIKIDGHVVKPHQAIQVGDQIDLREQGRTLRYEVKGLLDKRVGAPLARQQYNLTEDPDLTPEAREMIELYREADKGIRHAKGRPTKRDRRLIRRLKGE